MKKAIAEEAEGLVFTSRVGAHDALGELVEVGPGLPIPR